MLHRLADEAQILLGSVAQGDGLRALIDLMESQHEKTNVVPGVGYVKYFTLQSHTPTLPMQPPFMKKSNASTASSNSKTRS